MKKILILLVFCLSFNFLSYAQNRYEAIWDTLWSVKSETLKDSPWSTVTTRTPVLKGVYGINSADSINKVLSGGRLFYERQISRPMEMPYGLLFYETALFHKIDSLVKLSGHIDAVGHKSFFTNKKDFIVNQFLLVGFSLVLLISLLLGILMKKRFGKGKKPYDPNNLVLLGYFFSVVFVIIYSISCVSLFRVIIFPDVRGLIIHIICVFFVVLILETPLFLYCKHLHNMFIKKG